MFRHVVLFRWQEGTEPEEAAAALDEVRRLPSLIPEIRGYSVGEDARVAEGTLDAVVVADFDDETGYRTYAQHPEHVRVVQECLRPLLAERAAVQYEA